VTVIQTDSGGKIGHNNCPTCGGTDIALNIDSGCLRCNACFHELETDVFAKAVTDISSLDGTVVGSGAVNIPASVDDVLTFGCDTCGAEIVVDTSESLLARCHWCRNNLSVNRQIPNGAVPDKVLPFSKKKVDAQAKINAFVRKRQFFAHRKFKSEFTAENVIGVYLPYMVVDINSNAYLAGHGERLVDEYEINDTNFYDADLYELSRKFSLIVENLTIESNVEKLRHQSSSRTNNIVNAVMPFDTENSLRWNSYFMRGFTSQKRDADLRDLSGLIDAQVRDIARHQARQTIGKYDRGVRWDEEKLHILGSQWKAAYLPIWLYSYKHGDSIHYVAVNGRNLNTMGSVPINMPRLWVFSAIAQLIGIVTGVSVVVIMFYLGFDEESFAGLILFGLGPLFFWLVYSKYRNQDARFEHESSADARMGNLQTSDDFVESIEGTTREETTGRNDDVVLYGGKG